MIRNMRAFAQGPLAGALRELIPGLSAHHQALGAGHGRLIRQSAVGRDAAGLQDDQA
jgi:hypothetical protein